MTSRISAHFVPGPYTMVRFLSLGVLGFLFLLLSTIEAGENDFRPRMRSRRHARTGTYEEEYAYVDVRDGAHLFYWVQYTTHSDGFEKRPLIFWHQGGPGAGSSGYGNFEIIGPEDIFGKQRNTTWLQSVSIVYLDSPVGSGFSYVDKPSAYATDIDQMAADLLAFAKVFFTSNRDFNSAPLYIFGESYGGKVSAAFGQVLNKAIKAGTIKANLKGVVLGDAWISPMDSVNTWGPYLHEMSVVDRPGLAAIKAAAARTQKACDEGRWKDCTDEWSRTEYVIMAKSNYVSFYNILEYMDVGYNGVTYRKGGKEVFSTRTFPELGIVYDIMLAPYASDNLIDYMNNEVRSKVGIIPDKVTWGGQSGNVFSHNEGDFMKDVLDIVDDLLNNTDLHVIVYQGQLDLICDTKGAMDWTQRLKWSGIKEYNKATRKALTEPLDGQTDSYIKAYNNFKFYWMLRAGHMVPADMGPASFRMLERIIQDKDR